MFRLPPFYKEDPEVWFKQIDCAFMAAGIQSDCEKYCHFVANIEPQVLTLIADIVAKPSTVWGSGYFDGFYAVVKGRIRVKFQHLGKVEFCKLFKDGPDQSTKSDNMDNPAAPNAPNISVDTPKAWSNLIQAIAALMSNVNLGEQKRDVQQLFKDDISISSMSDDVELKTTRMLEAEFARLSKEECNTTPNNSLEKRIEELEKKINEFTPNNSLEEHVAVLEKMTNVSNASTMRERCKEKFIKETKASNLNNSLEERLAALEERINDSCASKVSLDNYLAETKQKMDNLLSWNVALDKYVAEVEQKLNDSAPNVNTSITKRLLTIERKTKDSDALVIALQKKTDHLQALNTTFDDHLRELKDKINHDTADGSFNNRIVTLEEMMNDSVSKATLNASIKEVKMQMLELVNSVAFVEKYVEELEGNMRKVKFLSASN